MVVCTVDLYKPPIGCSFPNITGHGVPMEQHSVGVLFW